MKLRMTALLLLGVLALAACGGGTTTESIAQEACDLLEEFFGEFSPEALAAMSDEELADAEEKLAANTEELQEQAGELSTKAEEAGISDEEMAAAVTEKCPDLATF